MGHKIAPTDQEGRGDPQVRQTIGFASQDIPAGGHVHVHNVAADSFGATTPSAATVLPADRPG
jgi:hypothetical protein